MTGPRELAIGDRVTCGHGHQGEIRQLVTATRPTRLRALVRFVDEGAPFEQFHDLAELQRAPGEQLGLGLFGELELGL